MKRSKSDKKKCAHFARAFSVSEGKTCGYASENGFAGTEMPLKMEKAGANGAGSMKKKSLLKKVEET